jgi:hypothetical protein
VSVMTSNVKEPIAATNGPPPSDPITIPDRDWFAEGAAAVRQPEVADECDLAQDRILDGLLRMADLYRSNGSLRQAIEMYFSLVHNYTGTPQAADAVLRLLDVARGYEDAGELRQARGLYEHLLRS